MNDKEPIVDEGGNPVYNIRTGERLTSLSTIPEISDALRHAVEYTKNLEQMEDRLKDLLAEDIRRVYDMGEKKYQDFWNMGTQTRFDSKLFDLKASDDEKREYERLKAEIKIIEDKYKVIGKPFLKYPKL